MKFLSPKDERGMSRCCWNKELGCIKGCAAFILKDPFCFYGFLDVLFGLEKFME
jgi:hypothetical protein